MKRRNFLKTCVVPAVIVLPHKIKETPAEIPSEVPYEVALDSTSATDAKSASRGCPKLIVASAYSYDIILLDFSRDVIEVYDDSEFGASQYLQGLTNEVNISIANNNEKEQLVDIFLQGDSTLIEIEFEDYVYKFEGYITEMSRDHRETITELVIKPTKEMIRIQK
jgi:hypothetical protein